MAILRTQGTEQTDISYQDMCGKGVKAQPQNAADAKSHAVDMRRWAGCGGLGVCGIL